MDCAHLFKGKKITVLGLGLLGRGVGDVDFLAKCGAKLLVTDKKSETELAESVAKLKQYPNITFRLGGHDTADFKDRDFILKAASVPLDSPYIAEARRNGIPIKMGASWFLELADIWSVGVTGTRGKSTVTQLIYEIVSAVRGKDKVHLGGNIRGISTLALLTDVNPGKKPDGDIAVLELDSWQLQGFAEAKMSPHVAVFTNFMPDHLNYYGGDMDPYFADKANIYKFQKSGDVLVVGNMELYKKIGEETDYDLEMVPANIESFPSVAEFANWKLKIIGEHNRQNALCAIVACKELGISLEEMRPIVEDFSGVEGRLQLVREVNGVKIYNDNNSTTPDATIAALRALGSDITLVVGGSEKGLPLEELVSEIKNRVSFVFLLTHSNYGGSTRLADSLQKAGIAYEEAREFSGAVTSALEKTKSGIVLFSPAFASFGMFKNEYDRGDQFLEIVRTTGGAA